MVVSPSPGDVEPDLLDDQQEVVGHEYVPTTPEGSDGEKAAVSHWSSHDREKRRKVEVESSPDPYTLPGDVQRASPGWMFLEFVTMLSVERSELVFRLNHHLQGPR